LLRLLADRELLRFAGKAVAQREPLREPDARPFQLGAPERLRGTGVEPDASAQLAVGRARQQVLQREHAARQAQAALQRFERFQRGAAEVDAIEADIDVGVHAVQRGNVEFALRQHAAAGGHGGRVADHRLP